MAVSGGGKRLRLGEILIKAGLITDEQLGIGLNKQKQTREPIGEILIKLGFVTDDQIRHALELQYGVKSVSLKNKIPLEIVKLLPENLIRQHLILPVGISHMTIAMVDPTNFMALDDVRLRLKGVYIEPVVVSEAEFHEFLKQLPKQEAARPAMPMADAKPDARPAAPQSLDENNPAQLATNILNNAIRRRATEVIVEPQEAETVIRYRIDGVFQKETLSAKMAQSLVSRFKVQADINPGQVPQSGAFIYNYEGRAVKVFLNSIPVKLGQMLRLKLYDSRFINEGSLDAIVQHPEAAKHLRSILSRNSGLVLFNGPLGSWKTTLMYACLKELTKSNRTMVTLELHPAYEVDGICQAVVNDDLSPAAMLDAIVKQRPDILVVPNLTDPEMAEKLVQVALSGCLVLAGVNSTQGVLIEAMEHWKIPPRLFANALAGIVTQRVVRKLCDCKGPYQPDPQAAEYFRQLNGSGMIHRATGCPACNKTGYKGQTAVVEVIAGTPNIRELIARGASKNRVAMYGRQMGMVPLSDYASWLVAHGHSSLEEMAKADVFEVSPEPSCPKCGQSESQCTCNKEKA